MKRALKLHVIKEIFDGQPPPPTTSRRFFPENRDIYNHLYRSRKKLIFSKIDQENLFQKIKEWKMLMPEDSIYFREYGAKCQEKMFYNENAERISMVNTQANIYVTESKTESIYYLSYLYQV